jgi:hypothetical protein
MEKLKSRRKVISAIGLGAIFLTFVGSGSVQAQSHSGKSSIKGKGKSGGSHSDSSHDDDHTDDNHTGDDTTHDDSEHSDGKRGPKYQGGRDTTNTTRGKGSSTAQGKGHSLEDRVLHAD